MCVSACVHVGENAYCDYWIAVYKSMFWVQETLLVLHNPLHFPISVPTTLTSTCTTIPAFLLLKALLGHCPGAGSVRDQQTWVLDPGCWVFNQ